MASKLAVAVCSAPAPHLHAENRVIRITVASRGSTAVVAAATAKDRCSAADTARARTNGIWLAFKVAGGREDRAAGGAL